MRGLLGVDRRAASTKVFRHCAYVSERPLGIVGAVTGGYLFNVFGLNHGPPLDLHGALVATAGPCWPCLSISRHSTHGGPTHLAGALELILASGATLLS